MAASMDNRRQPENPEQEQRTQQVRPRPRLGQKPQKQFLAPEVPPVQFQLPERRLRRIRQQSHLNAHEGSERVASLRTPDRLPSGTGRAAMPNQGMRRRMSVVTRLQSPVLKTPTSPKAVILRQLTPQRMRQQLPTPTPDHLRQVGHRAKRSPGQYNPDLNPYRTQESGYKKEENLSVSNPRSNPWAVHPKSAPAQMPHSPKTTQSKGGTQGNRRGSQNPKSVDTSRRRNDRTSVEAQPSVRSKSPSKLDNRQREQSQSRTTAAVSSGFSPQSSKKNQTSRRPQKRPVSPLVYILRLLILGIGIGALVGTIISALYPATHASVKNKDTAKTQIQESPTQRNPSSALPPGQEILPLKAKIQALVAQNPQLQPGVFIVDLDTGAYLDWNGNSSLAAASTIKVPILVAFFQDVDAGKIRLDEPLTMQPEMMVGGSGDLQYKQPGTQYTALEVATKMIVISDNTATNMLIARLGGAEVLNQRFQSWGLSTTVLRNPLPDIEGTNTTSPSELAKVISIVNRGELVLWQSRDRLLNIMQQTQLNTLLPKGLGTGATIAHKTGTIGSLLADVGLVDTPSGKRYIIAVMVKRSRNDPTADELIRQISRETYAYFNPPRATPSTTSMPIGSTATLSQAIASEKEKLVN